MGSCGVGSDALQATDFEGIWLPEGVKVGWGVSEAREAFVASLVTGVDEKAQHHLTSGTVLGAPFIVS